MNKKYVHTLFSLGIAVIFLFGGMQFMLYLLHIREADLLSEEGKVMIESPVRAWGENENFDEATERYVLTTEQIEEAVNSWNNREWEIIHNPVDGQISLKEAIEAGENWLIDMGVFQEKPKGYSVNAVLGIGNQKQLSEVQAEPFYSFWTVAFTSQSEQAVLYINAVSGNVYGAELVLYDNLQDVYSYEKLELFVESLDLKGTELVIYEDQAVMPIEDSEMTAGIKVSLVQKQICDLYKMDEMIEIEYAIVEYELKKNDE